jgi:hypothetical protein
MWEICTQARPDLLALHEIRARGPFFSQLLAVLQDGIRLPLSNGDAPEWCQLLMDQAWATDPAVRPSFAAILTVLRPHVDLEVSL